METNNCAREDSVPLHYVAQLEDIRKDISRLRVDLQDLLETSFSRLEQSQNNLFTRCLTARLVADDQPESVVPLSPSSATVSQPVNAVSPQQSTTDGANCKDSISRPSAPSIRSSAASLCHDKSSIWIERAAKLEEHQNRIVEGIHQIILTMFRNVYNKCRRRRQQIMADHNKNLPNALSTFVNGSAFSWFTAIVIFCNTAYLGYDVDRHVKRAIAHVEGRDSPPISAAFEYIFTAYFVIELCLKVATDRWTFLIGKDWSWNIFDILLVLTAIMEILFKSGIPNVSFARVLRLCRLVRFVRVVRTVHVLQSLRTMLLGIIRCAITLAWALLMLVLVQYIIAMILLNGVANFLDEQAQGSSPELAQNMYASYGGIVDTLCRLFEGISGGEDWSHLANLLEPCGYAYYYVWVFYVFAMLFGIMNVVTGIVVDASVQQANKDRSEVMRENILKQREAMNSLRKIFIHADDDKSGTLSWSEFERHFADEDVQHLLETFEIEIDHIADLFRLLDYDQDDKVKIDEFVGGFMHARGTARSLDLLGISTKQLMVLEELRAAKDIVALSLQQLREDNEKFDVLLDHLKDLKGLQRQGGSNASAYIGGASQRRALSVEHSL